MTNKAKLIEQLSEAEKQLEQIKSVLVNAGIKLEILGVDMDSNESVEHCKTLKYHIQVVKEAVEINL